MLTIAFINGSPKAKESASGCLLKELKGFLQDSEITEFRLRTAEGRDLAEILKNDVLVFSFPLYVDGIPSHLLRCLTQLEELSKESKPTAKVYAICNSGFYEGHQNRHALQMIENWCAKSELNWGQGIGIGGGGMILSIQSVPSGKGPKKKISSALATMAGNILSTRSESNLYTAPGFPRFLYKLSAEMGWRQAVKANGHKTGDLSTRR